MKSESLVIAGQPYRGEYVLKACTHQKMRPADYISRWLKSIPLLIQESVVEKQFVLATERAEGLETNSSPNH